MAVLKPNFSRKRTKLEKKCSKILGKIKRFKILAIIYMGFAIND
jgi:hypothetical protein